MASIVLDVAVRDAWTSGAKARDHLAGDSFILTGTEGDRGPDLYLTWDPLVSEEQRAADQDFIARARQDVPDMAAELRELRAWHELLDEDEEAPNEEAEGATIGPPEGYRSPTDLYVVETDPSLPETVQAGAFTTHREAFKALRRAQAARPSDSWVINRISVWERFTDFRSGQ